jgi:asparagine synthase (glutamine-hydrolysing)
MNGTETEQYRIWLLAGSVWISSEMKALNDECEHFEIFPPGHLYSSNTKTGGGFSRWYNPPWYDEAIIPSVPYNPLALRKAFEKVNKLKDFQSVLGPTN